MIKEISLKSARVNASLNQDDVTRSIRKTLGIRVSRQRLSYWEKGNYNNIPLKIAFYLSRLYKIPFDALFYDAA